MDEDTQHAIEVARASYSDEEWESLDPRLKTELIYRALQQIDAARRSK